MRCSGFGVSIQVLSIALAGLIGSIGAPAAAASDPRCGGAGDRACRILERDDLGPAACELGLVNSSGSCVVAATLRTRHPAGRNAFAELPAETLERGDAACEFLRRIPGAQRPSLLVDACRGDEPFSADPASSERRAGGSAAATCNDPGMPAGCVEVWPGQSGAGYQYYPTHDVYFFPNLSGADHFFLLMGDLDCPTTCTIFGFPDATPDDSYLTTFDLNGYELRYSDANYPTLSNNGFELWTGNDPQGWSVLAGTVEPRESQFWQPMSGDWVLYSPAAVVLESSPLTLPVARAYQGYASVGKTDVAAATQLEVLDAANNVVCSGVTLSGFGYLRGETVSCRFDAAAAGDYRLRLTTNGYAYFDRTGIVPVGDYGVASLTAAELAGSALSTNLAGLTIPLSGTTTAPTPGNRLEVTNGRISAAHENQESYGVSVKGEVFAELHQLTVVGNGIKSHTLDAFGDLHDNTLIADMPWYFRRQESDEENVILRGGSFRNNVAIGGQGVIRLKGTATEVHDNYLSNNAQATNHYAIIHSGAVDPEIRGNLFDPIEGSGILTYIGAGYRIHNNVFHVRTAPCNVEYINEDYSTNGIRINDYGSAQSTRTRVYDNYFNIRGSYQDSAWPNCQPITNGIFYSASGSDNQVHDNLFRVIKDNDEALAPAFALYIGDGFNNPQDNPLFFNNVIETNDKAVWISSPYGATADLWFENNQYVRLDNAYYSPVRPDAAIRMGQYGNYASNVRMINDRFFGFDPDAYEFSANSSSATYDLTRAWYLHVNVTDAQGDPAGGAQVTASSVPHSEYVVQGTTAADGSLTLRVVEYVESGELTPGGNHDRDGYGPFDVQVTLAAEVTTVNSVVVEHETALTVQSGVGLISSCSDCLTDVIVDNSDPGSQQSGSWPGSSFFPGFYGADYRYNSPEDQGGLWFQWSATLPPAAYEVYARWPDTGSGRPVDVEYQIDHPGGTAVLSGVDQNVDGAQWNLLGVWDFAGSAAIRVVSGSTGTQGTAADAIRFREVCPGAPGEVDLRFMGDDQTLVWGPAPGAGGATTGYDVLRSASAADFVLRASCLEADDAGDTTVVDAELPLPGSAFFYLVRAENVCGLGALGTDSSGAERAGLVCSLGLP